MVNMRDSAATSLRYGAPVFITVDQRLPLEDGLNQMRFISHNSDNPAFAHGGGIGRRSSVYKDYVISPEPYRLPSIT